MNAATRFRLHLPNRDGRRPAPSAAEIGGKAHALSRLEAAGVEVPRWFAVPAAIFRNLVPDEVEYADDAGRLREHVLSIETPTALADAIASALTATRLAGFPLAVRSSAAGEDAAGASFAGQFDTVLGVPGDATEVVDAIRRVWASAFSPHAVAYGGGGAMAVIVQELVDPAVAGVAFGADPVTGDEALCVVSAVHGLGEGLVSGEMDADTWRIAAGDDGPDAALSIVSREIASKPVAIRPDAAGGTRTEDVPADLRNAPALTDAEAITIARTVRRLGDELGGPRDVEWALVGEERRLVILQARPITTLGEGGERRLWDNSNIVESYAGITSPLTFSFARSVYEEVYRQFCALVGVSGQRIDRNRHVFANMLGLVRGRVFYNLRNWYRVLALLPGFALNRAFMERMMGVREPLPDPVVGDGSDGKVRDAVRVGRMVRRLARESRRLKQEVPAFHALVDRVLAPLGAADLNGWSADRLTALYRQLEDDLLRRWQTPIVNDFFAMLWFGLLGRLVERWLPEEPPTLVNDLLTHEGGVISTEPARQVAVLTDHVRADEELTRLFASEPDDGRLLHRIEGEAPAFHAALRAYIDRFGDRCMNELKLETVTLREDPAFLIRTLRGYLAGGVRPVNPSGAAPVRRAAEARVATVLRGVRRRLFSLVLGQTRLRVRDRENLRFERTRVFGMVRRIFVGFGHHFVRSGVLDEARDVFFLWVEEVFAHVEGTGTTGDLRALVALRRATWRTYEEGPPPPDRFESVGPPELGRWITPDAVTVDVDAALSGTGCCPGIVRAPVRLVRDPNNAGDLAGRILVAERTDPGWTLLFPQARGILVERGSLLSHSAIVAREMSIPCIVAVPGLLSTLRDGEMVEMDGAAGIIRRLEDSGASDA